jgi:hypothetical protein
MAPLGCSRVVSTRIPVSATIRSSIVARIAQAARPNADEPVDPLAAAALVDGVVSADTGVPEAGVEVD